MAALWLVTFFSVLAVLHSSDTKGQAPQVYMLNDLCGKTIDIEHSNVTSGLFTLFNKKRTVRVDFSCFITLRAPLQHRVLLRFVDADIDGGWMMMCEDYVYIFDQKYVHEEDKDKKEAIGKVVLCGDDPPDENYMSRGREMTIYYHTNVFASDVGYKMYFNAFNTMGTCSSGEFKCDNGYCIDNRLKCNGYNNCGDSSDMCFSILPIILGGVGAGLFVCIIVIWCCYCRRRKSNNQGKGNKDKVVTTETIPMNPPTKAAAQPYPKYVPHPSPARGYVPPPQPPAQNYDQTKEYPSHLPVGDGVYPYSGQSAYYALPPSGEGGYPSQGQGMYPPPKYSPSAQVYQGQQDVYPSAPPRSRDEYYPPEYTSPALGYTDHAAYDRKA